MNLADMPVDRIMNPGVVTCNPGHSLTYVAQLMSYGEVSALVVVDKEGAICGVVSQMDLLPRIKDDLAKVTAGEVMTRKVITIARKTTVGDAANLMLVNETTRLLHRLVVVDTASSGEQRPVGVVSVADVIRELAGRPD